MLSVIRFFFSSRRRHTRSKRDWSSDVCSSDLDQGPHDPPPTRAPRRIVGPLISSCRRSVRPMKSSFVVTTHGATNRSEERRVGKESIYRWWPHQHKEKGKKDI